MTVLAGEDLANAAGEAHVWLGPKPSLRQQLAAFFIGVVGVMFAGVGPLLLGGLQAAHRLNTAQLGEAGTVELLSMGLGAALAGPIFGVRRLRLIAVLCSLLIGALNYATTRASGDGVTLVRALAGVPSGVLIWLAVGLIVRSPRPERWSGIYLTVQTLAQLAAAALISIFVIGPFGVDGGFMALAGLAAVAAVISLWAPSAYVDLPKAIDSPKGMPSPRGWAALAVGLFFQAFVLAVWIYMEPLARQSGQSAQSAGGAISLCLGAQVAGGTAATVLAGRVSWFWALMASILAAVGLLAVFSTLPTAPVFMIASAAFGFVWLFASPYLTPLAIEADPSRRAAALGPGATLLGCGVGPFLASLVVSDADVRGCLGLAAGLAGLCMLIITSLQLTRRKRA